MAPKGHRTGSAAQPRTHSRSSSATRVGANLQITQKESKKNLRAQEGGRPGVPRVNSSQSVPPMKRTGSASSATEQNENATKANAGFTITQTADDEDDEDEWVSSSGAQTPNQDASNSDTASEGDNIPQRELVTQLQRAQLEQQQGARNQAPPPRIDTVRQSDFNAQVAPKNGAPKQPLSTQTPFPTTNSDPNIHPGHNSQYTERDRLWVQPQQSSDHVGTTARETNHTRTESRQAHLSKRQSVTRPPSTHSISSRSDIMRPHPLIRGQSQGLLNLVPKPSPLAPLTVITDQPSNTSDNPLSASPESIRTTVTSPGAYTAGFPQRRRTSFSSARSVSTLPVQSAGLPPNPQDRTRTLSTISMTASTTALSSLAHLPSVTRPPSPQQISFFPPVNPHVNIEAIHPLLPGPYLNNHLTVLTRRTPLRESYDRVIQAKIASGR